MSTINEVGTYDVKVTGAVIEPVGQNSNPAARVTFTTDESGNYIDDCLWLTDKAISYTVDKLKGMGWKAEKMETLEEDILGHECSIIVDVDASSEKGYLRVKYINRRHAEVSEDTIKSATATAQSNLDAYLGALAAHPASDLPDDDLVI